jgi:hypothetical protein
MTRIREGDVGGYAGPATPETWSDGPLGHILSAHTVFGWCCHEPGRTVDEELWAWRLKWQREHP